MSDDNVVHLKRLAFPLRRGKRDPQRPSCFHLGGSYVDIVGRTVECSTCGAQLDPITVLGQIATDCEWVVAMRREKGEIAAEIEALKGERARLASSVRAAAKRAR